jgi:hypothetical protein
VKNKILIHRFYKAGFKIQRYSIESNLKEILKLIGKIKKIQIKNLNLDTLFFVTKISFPKKKCV